MAYYKDLIKPLIDHLFGLTFLIILFPVLLLISLLLIITNKGRPFFTQLRPGRNEKKFYVIKFKTMTDKRDDEGKLLPDSERLTKVGRFIRSTSLDELPQLINVLKGDMSFVGPRPLLIKYLPLYNNHQKRRHEVKPGITGWAQVNGRNAISWEKKLELDVYYVENLSFALDLKIFWLTFIKVLRREGINKEGNATTESFKGNN